MPLTSNTIRESWKFRLKERIHFAKMSPLAEETIGKLRRGRVLVVLGAGMVRNVWTSLLRIVLEITEHLVQYCTSTTVRSTLEKIIERTKAVLDFESGNEKVPSEIKEERIDEWSVELADFLKTSANVPEAFKLKMLLTEHYLKTPSFSRLSYTAGCIALLIETLERVQVLDLTYAHDLSWACYHLGVLAQTIHTAEAIGNRTIFKPHGVSYMRCSDCPIFNSVWLFSHCLDCPTAGPFRPNVIFVPPGQKREDSRIYEKIAEMAMDADVLLIVAFSGKRDPEIASAIEKARVGGKTIIDVDYRPDSTAFWGDGVIPLKGGASTIMPQIMKSLEPEIWKRISSQKTGGEEENTT